jgi:rRNA-processing protein FCF1
MTARRSGSPSGGPKIASRGRPRVVVDTNALFLVVRSGFPLDAEVGRIVPGARLLVPSSVLIELEGLSKSLTAGAVAARALAERYELAPTTRRGDEGIVDVALASAACVVTADRDLGRRLATLGVTTLIPRDRHRLELVRGRPLPRPASRPPARRPPARGNG